MGSFACISTTGRCIGFDQNGKLHSEFIVAVPRQPVSDADWRLALELHLGTEPSAEYRRVAPAVLAEIQMRMLLPRFDRILTDDLGRLWVRTTQEYRDPVAQWLVLSPDGQSTHAIVRVPRRIELLRAGSDYAIGLLRDDDDVESVGLWRIASIEPPSQ